MPDQAPPAPEGCVYGPWWDDEDIRIGGCWCYSDGTFDHARIDPADEAKKLGWGE